MNLRCIPLKCASVSCPHTASNVKKTSTCLCVVYGFARLFAAEGVTIHPASSSVMAFACITQTHMCTQVVLCTSDAAQRAQATEAVETARAAAETHASLAAQRSGSGTGEMLRSNFVVVADLVLGQDGHLLSPEEHTTTAAFKVTYPTPVMPQLVCIAIQLCHTICIAVPYRPHVRPLPGLKR